MKDAHDIDVETSLVLGLRYIDRRLVIITCACILDKNIYYAKLRQYGIQGTLPVLSLGYIHLLY